jgi:hypothetical protein
VKKNLIIGGFMLLHVQFACAQTEELSGPPAVFSLEKLTNLEDDLVLDMIDLPSNVSDVSITLDVSRTAKELIEEESFIGKLRFVSHRSNRQQNMIFDSQKIKDIAQKQDRNNMLSALIIEASSETETALDVNALPENDADKVSNTGGQSYKNFQVYMSQCLHDYNSVYGNDVAFVKINDLNTGDVIYEGWLYKKRPSVNVFEHPVYSLHLLSCE